MKKAISALALLLAVGLLFGDIYSTTAGGFWGSTTTWEGGTVPSSGDNVVLQGPVFVTNGGCAALTVNAGGSLYNPSGATGNIYVYGQLTNLNRIYKNTSGSMNVYLYANAHNEGEFTSSAVYLAGNVLQTISGNAPFAPVSFVDTNFNTPVTLQGDTVFMNTSIDLNNATLNLNGNLTLSGGSLQEAYIYPGAAGGITLASNSYLASLNIYNSLTLNGEGMIGSSVYFYNLVNNATIYNRTGQSVSCYISNQLTNYGTIRNNPAGYTLSLTFSGQYLYNYATLSNYTISFTRGSTMYLLHDSPTPISVYQFFSGSSSGPLQLLSDVSFLNCATNFYNRYLYVTNGGDSYDVNYTGGSLINTQCVGDPASIMTLNGTNINGFVYCQNSVSLQGTVTLQGTNSFYNLTNSGILQNYSGSAVTLPVNGNLVNNPGGIIRNNSGLLSINLAGDFYNYGAISNQSISLNNSATANLFHDQTSPIACVTFASTGAGGFQLLSDLEFSNCNLDFANRTVVMHDGGGDYGLSVSGSGRYLQNAVLDGGEYSYLNVQNNAYIVNITANRLLFFGDVTVKQGVSVDWLINNGTLKNYSGTNQNLLVNQRLENFGAIQNGASSGLFISLYGDLHNAGTIDNSGITLYGSADCNLSQTGVSSFVSPTSFVSQKSSGSIRLHTDMNFSACAINLNNALLIMSDGRAATNLNLSGGSLQLATIDGINGSTLILSDNAWIQYITADLLYLAGTVLVGPGVNIADLTNFGTLQAYTGSQSLNVSTHLENAGTIQDGGAALQLNIYLQGHLFNFGIIQNHSIQISGSSTHNLYHDSSTPISCANLSVDGESGDIQMLTGISFANCTVNLGGRNLRMYAMTGPLNLSLNASSLTSAVLVTTGFSTLTLENNSYLSYVTGQDNILAGSITIVDYCVFMGELRVLGTVQNGVDGAVLYCMGDLVNLGTLLDNPAGGGLHLLCQADIDNQGSLLNALVTIDNDGLDDQYLLLSGPVSNSGGFILQSGIGVSDWYLNGVLQIEDQSQIAVDPTVIGVWKPVSPSGPGRSIIISNGAALTPPASPNLVSGTTGYTLVWNQVPNAIYYKVYASQDPLSGFVLFLDRVYDPDPSDGVMWIETTLDSQYKFYRVSAWN